MSKNTRRDFIKQAAMGTAAFLAYPTARVLGANERVRLAMIGVGSRGQELLKQTLDLAQRPGGCGCRRLHPPFRRSQKNLARPSDRK